MESKFANDDLIFVDPEVAADSGKYVVVHLAEEDEEDFGLLNVEAGRHYMEALSPDWLDRNTAPASFASCLGILPRL